MVDIVQAYSLTVDNAKKRASSPAGATEVVILEDEKSLFFSSLRTFQVLHFTSGFAHHVGIVEWLKSLDKSLK